MAQCGRCRGLTLADVQLVAPARDNVTTPVHELIDLAVQALAHPAPLVRSARSAKQVVVLPASAHPDRGIAAKRPDFQSLGPGNLHHPDHELACCVGAAQRRRGFHVRDDQRRAMPSLAGEHDLPAEFKLEAALVRIVPHFGHAATSARPPIQVPPSPTKWPAFVQPLGWTTGSNPRPSCRA